jgi:hypothetical protein
MRLAVDIFAMLPADAIGHSAVPSGERVAEGAILVALILCAVLLPLLARARARA